MASAKATIDHDEIREWVEVRGGYPARVRQSGDDADPGILRIDYPGFSGQGTLERISWDEFFEAFDSNKLAFLYQDESDSRFSKLVDRGTVDVSGGGGAKRGRAGRAGTRPRSIVERITSAVTGGGRKSASSSKKRSASSKKRSASSSRKRSSAKASSSKKRSAASSKKRSSAKKSSSKKRTSSKKASSSKKRGGSSRKASSKKSSKRRTSGRTAGMSSSRSAVTTTNHDEIRKWVDARGGFPAHVKRTGSRKDPGVLRIDYPGFSGKQTLERISWDEWFNWFDRDKLAFLYQKKGKSRFSKLVRR